MRNRSEQSPNKTVNPSGGSGGFIKGRFTAAAGLPWSTMKSETGQGWLGFFVQGGRDIVCLSSFEALGVGALRGNEPSRRYSVTGVKDVD